MKNSFFPLLMISALVVQSVDGFQLLSRSMHSRSVPERQCAKRRSALSMRWGLKAPGGAPNKPMGDLEEGKFLRDTVPFELRGFSLPLVVFSAGALLTASSFAGFFLNDGGADGAVSSIGFVYGIPVFLIGLSLWYAEIPPVQVQSSEAGDRAWENKSTDTLQKIKQDVTRHRYGDDAHLDSTLEALGLKLPQRKFPRMQTIIQEETEDGELACTFTFQSLDTPYKVWADPARVFRYSKYFGPNVIAEVLKIDADKRIVGLKLTTCSDEKYEAFINGPAPASSTGTAAPATVAPSAASETVDAGVDAMEA